MVHDNRLIETILSKLQDIFRELHASSLSKNIAKYGKTPTTAYLEQYGNYGAEAMLRGQTILKWQMTTDAIEVKELSDYCWTKGNVDGIYYSQANFGFSISEDMKFVVVEYLLGPRYGRGLSYKIEETNGMFELTNVKHLWVS